MSWPAKLLIGEKHKQRSTALIWSSRLITEETNPKPEIRNPKEIRRPKSELLSSGAVFRFEFRISGFVRISDFGFRISFIHLFVPMHFPAKIIAQRLLQHGGALRQIHHHVMFEALFADVAHELLQIRDA